MFRTAVQRFSFNGSVRALPRVRRAPVSCVLSRSLSTGPLTRFSEDEVLLRENVARFAREQIGPKVAEMDENAKLDAGVLKQCFEQGIMGIEIPEKYGGTGMNITSACLTIEQIARVDPGVSVVVDVQNTLVNNAIIREGTEEQRQKYLPRLASDTLASFCLSEWGSGSDAFAMKTKAEKDGNEWVINGSKAWITNANEAGLFLVMANVAPEKGYKGITTFIVERDNSGLSVAKKEPKLGIRASSTCEVVLEDCRVSEDAVLGQVGKGYKIAIETLNEGRIGIAAQMLGLAQGAFDATIPYLKERKQFGKTLGSFQAIQHQFAKAAIDIEAARLLVYNAARLKEAGMPFVKEAAMAKYHAALCAERVSSECINMMGGVGFTKHHPMEKFYRDCKIGQIYEGTNNIQLTTIAKQVLNEFD
eukprot:TRINITY_DN17515_c0_g1_i1.p1 TRINITY_DN17515_c0_g1~~TRINITY_DN17515_c0_g1_i1.p1  ORF type:complete len:419 (+),score=77.79 TRINITY_DN17515_c0_g1_i1:167-1423(+)